MWTSTTAFVVLICLFRDSLSRYCNGVSETPVVQVCQAGGITGNVVYIDTREVPVQTISECTCDVDMGGGRMRYVDYYGPGGGTGDCGIRFSYTGRIFSCSTGTYYQNITFESLTYETLYQQDVAPACLGIKMEGSETQVTITCHPLPNTTTSTTTSSTTTTTTKSTTPTTTQTKTRTTSLAQSTTTTTITPTTASSTTTSTTEGGTSQSGSSTTESTTMTSRTKPPTTEQATKTDGPSGDGLSQTTIIAIGAGGGGAVIIILVVVVICCCIRRSKHKSESGDDGTVMTENDLYNVGGVTNVSHTEALGSGALYATVDKTTDGETKRQSVKGNAAKTPEQEPQEFSTNDTGLYTTMMDEYEKGSDEAIRSNVTVRPSVDVRGVSNMYSVVSKPRSPAVSNNQEPTAEPQNETNGDNFVPERMKIEGTGDYYAIVSKPKPSNLEIQAGKPKPAPKPRSSTKK